LDPAAVAPPATEVGLTVATGAAAEGEEISNVEGGSLRLLVASVLLLVEAMREAMVLVRVNESMNEWRDDEEG
jgi:hypothetical protein